MKRLEWRGGNRTINRGKRGNEGRKISKNDDKNCMRTKREKINEWKVTREGRDSE